MRGVQYRRGGHIITAISFYGSPDHKQNIIIQNTFQAGLLNYLSFQMKYHLKRAIEAAPCAQIIMKISLMDYLVATTTVSPVLATMLRSQMLVHNTGSSEETSLLGT